jgi:hydrogenase maturation protease
MLQAAFLNNGRKYRRISIIGLGNILKGDLGLGCYVVEALQQEPLEKDVELCILRGDTLNVDICGHEAALSIFVQAVRLGEPPGAIQCWGYRKFLEHRRLFPDRYSPLEGLHRTLVRAEFAETLPDSLLFLWIEPWCTEGFALPKVGRKAFRAVVRTVKENLAKSGGLPMDFVRMERIYRFGLFGDKG